MTEGEANITQQNTTDIPLDFDEIAERQGWNHQTMLIVLRDYISSTIPDGGETLTEFAQQVADEENDQQPLTGFFT